MRTWSYRGLGGAKSAKDGNVTADDLVRKAKYWIEECGRRHRAYTAAVKKRGPNSFYATEAWREYDEAGERYDEVREYDPVMQ
jgi:hypothetical protein